jgi:hypothetical protein
MTADMYDTGSPTIEVRVHRGDELLARELCETEEEAATVVEKWSDVEGVDVLVDDLSAHHGPEDILAPDDLPLTDDEDHPVVSALIPGRGTE